MIDAAQKITFAVGPVLLTIWLTKPMPSQDDQDTMLALMIVGVVLFGLIVPICEGIFDYWIKKNDTYRSCNVHDWHGNFSADSRDNPRVHCCENEMTCPDCSMNEPWDTVKIRRTGFYRRQTGTRTEIGWFSQHKRRGGE